MTQREQGEVTPDIQPEPQEPLTGSQIMEQSVTEAGRGAVERHEHQSRGLRNAFEVAFGEYEDKVNELPDLKTETDVDHFVRARPELYRAIQMLDTVQGDVRRVALEVLEEMRAGRASAEDERKQAAA